MTESICREDVALGISLCYQNAKALTRDAKVLLARGSKARGFVLSCSALEEYAKARLLVQQDQEPRQAWSAFWRDFRSHIAKTSELNLILVTSPPVSPGASFPIGFPSVLQSLKEACTYVERSRLWGWIDPLAMGDEFSWAGDGLVSLADELGDRFRVYETREEALRYLGSAGIISPYMWERALELGALITERYEQSIAGHNMRICLGSPVRIRYVPATEPCDRSAVSDRRTWLLEQGPMGREDLVQGIHLCYRNAAQMAKEARLLLKERRRPRALVIGCLALEELGKLILLVGAGGLHSDDGPAWRRFWRRLRSHEAKLSPWASYFRLKKQFMSIARLMHFLRLQAFYVDHLVDYGWVPPYQVGRDLSSWVTAVVELAASRVAAFDFYRTTEGTKALMSWNTRAIETLHQDHLSEFETDGQFWSDMYLAIRQRWQPVPT